MATHRIRLRKPWRVEPVADGVCWRRRFGRPTGLAPGDQVWIVLGPIVPADGRMELNGQLLGRLSRGGQPERFDLTGRLAVRNEVSIVLAAAADRSGTSDESPFPSPGDVYLEIVSP